MEISIQRVFNPITITLETQEEINQLFAMLNFGSIGRAIKDDSNGWGKLYKELHNCKTSDYQRWHDRLLAEYHKR